MPLRPMKPSMTRYDDNSDSEEEVERIPPPPKMRRYASVGLKVMPVASMHDDDAPATVTRTFSVGDRLQKQFEDKGLLLRLVIFDVQSFTRR